MEKVRRCVHVVEDHKVCFVSDDGYMEFIHIWICNRCREQFTVDGLVRFLKAGSRTIH